MTRNSIAPSRSDDRQMGRFLVTASAVAWSTAGLFARLIPVDVWTMLAWRGLFGALGILAVMVAFQGRGAIAGFSNLGRTGWAFAVISAIGMLCFITSLRITTVAHVSVIYATVPLVAAGLAWIVLRERPSPRTLAASLAALVGVAVMVGLSREGDLFGDILAFGMTLVMAAMMVLSRYDPTIPIMPAACLSAVLSGLVAVLPSDGIAVGTQDLAMLAAFGLVNSAVGLSLFTLGARMLPSVEVALIGALEVPLAPIWVWLVFSETPGAATIAGGTIVALAILAHLLTETRSG